MRFSCYSWTTVELISCLFIVEETTVLVIIAIEISGTPREQIELLIEKRQSFIEDFLAAKVSSLCSSMFL